MPMTGIVTNESVQVVEGFAPIDTNGVGQTGNMICLKGSAHCMIIINTGAWAAGATGITLEQATDVTDSASTSKALGFSWMWTNIAATGASLLVKTAVTSNTFDIGTAASMHIIDVPADTLDIDNGYDCMQILTDTPGANADLIQATYILSGTRYNADNTPLSNQ